VEGGERASRRAAEGRPEKVELLTAITLHEARHCAASYLIAAGLNIKQISVYMGHSDVKTTLNVYGHLLPGDEVGAVAQVDAFFERSKAVAE
jgi:integrase